MQRGLPRELPRVRDGDAAERRERAEQQLVLAVEHLQPLQRVLSEYPSRTKPLDDAGRAQQAASTRLPIPCVRQSQLSPRVLERALWYSWVLEKHFSTHVDLA